MILHDFGPDSSEQWFCEWNEYIRIPRLGDHYWVMYSEFSRSISLQLILLPSVLEALQWLVKMDELRQRKLTLKMVENGAPYFLALEIEIVQGTAFVSKDLKM